MTGRGGFVRLGRLDFLNAYPVYLGLEILKAQGRRRPAIRLVGGGGNPVALNGMLLAGKIDVTPASTALLARHPDEVEPLPGLAIASSGRVGSVLLGGRVEPWALDGRTVALPANSATSVALLRILAKRLWRVAPRYLPWPGEPDIAAMLDVADAALIIGDAALVARHRFPGYCWTDLGEAWTGWTGLPMVFAPWTARSQWVRAQPALAEAVTATLAEALAAGRRSLPERIAVLAAARGLPEEVVKDYFYRCLDFAWTEAHGRGLRYYITLMREDVLPGEGVEAHAASG